MPLIIRRNQVSEFCSKTSKYWLPCTLSLSFEMATFKPDEVAHKGNPFSSHDTQAFTQPNLAWLHGRTYKESFVQKSGKDETEKLTGSRESFLTLKDWSLLIIMPRKLCVDTTWRQKKMQKNKIDHNIKWQSSREAMEPVLLCTGNSTLCHLFSFSQKDDKSLIHQEANRNWADGQTRGSF